MKKSPLRFFLLLALAVSLLGGCAPKVNTTPELPTGDTLQFGSFLETGNAFDNLTLREYNDALAADGLYYATWSLGDAVDYENEDGDTVPLYDAQLYLIAGEFTSAEKASDNKNTWLSAAAKNYVDAEQSVLNINGITYDILTYRCSESSPYERGISAFASTKEYAVCAEFTCRDTYTEDLTPTLTAFLETVLYH
ncbi:MAG: hypothetical protein Q4B09_11550 [Lachnospiraceae bacterium]|nr:hypothetical protein [Lachnospiraceae bacterium]